LKFIARSGFNILNAFLFFLLAGQPVEAGRLPTRDSAEELVDQLIDQTLNGQVGRDWIRKKFREANPYRQDPVAARAAEARIAGLLAPGGELYERFVRSSNIYGSTEGPDYVRVVLENNSGIAGASEPQDWFTVVIESPGGRPEVREFAFSSCGLCSEPERFVRDLFEEVERLGDASHRLLPGLELVVSSVHANNEWKRDRWVWAFVNRAAGAQYTTRMLRDAKVLGSRGRVVQVALKSGQESWPVLYMRERWWLDYGALASKSVWYLSEEDAEEWTQPDTVRKARIAHWEPDWRSRSQGIQVSDGALFLGARPLQEDLLLYDQDIGRRWAFWSLLDTEEGRVQARIDAPRLSRRMFVDTIGWPDLFRFALSPNGELFAVAAHDRVWVFDIKNGTTRWAEPGFPGGATLAFSTNGDSLAVLDRAIGGLQVFSTTGFKRLSTSRGPRGSLEMTWVEEGLLVLSPDKLSLVQPDGGADSLSLQCDTPQMSTLRGKGEVWVYCPSNQTQIIKVQILDIQDEPQQILLEGNRKVGDFALDPVGRWAVMPAKANQDQGMCLFNLHTGSEGPCFAPEPLRQIQFSADGATILGIDQRGRAWKWELLDLF
jgi:hypothetical protein